MFRSFRYWSVTCTTSVLVLSNTETWRGARLECYYRAFGIRSPFSLDSGYDANLGLTVFHCTTPPLGLDEVNCAISLFLFYHDALGELIA
jgi:hypothetical protein